jgi:hypothetical protein
LKEAVAGVSGVEVLSPPPFTWLLSGYDPTRPQYRFNGDIKDLDKPGNDFMKTVFGLTDMDVGTAMNQPKTIAYAIQLEKYDPANDSLWETFMGKEFKDYGGVGQLDINMARNNMILQLQEEAGLKFEPKENLNENDKSPSPEPSPSSDPGPFSGL